MAAGRLLVAFGETALVAATAKSIASFAAGANLPIVISALDFEGEGIVATDKPIIVRLTYLDAASGTGTSLTVEATTAAVMFGISYADHHQTFTPQGTYKRNYTVEPTSPRFAGQSWNFHPQSGIFLPFPLQGPIVIKPSGILYVEATAAQAQTITCNARVEE